MSPDLVSAARKVVLSGNTKPMQRFLTGIFSVDYALGDASGKRGMPMQSFELYGPTGCGKTTLAWFLAACSAKQYKGNILMTNVEPFDPEQLLDSMEFYDYQGNIHIADGETDEKSIDDAVTHLRKDQKICAYVFDSVGAVSPISELEGAAGESNIGRRARLVSPHSRQINNMVRHGNRQLFAVFINHVHQNIGTPGSSTTGGVTLGYLSANRIRVKRKEDLPYNSYSIEGYVVKNRFGWEDNKFWIVVLGGYGVHVGLSNVQGCLSYGLLEKPKSARAAQWKNTGEKIPTMKTLIEQALAGEGDWSVYEKALQGISDIPTNDVEAEDE